MKYIRVVLFVALLAIVFHADVYSQIGGKSSYSFLNYVNSARVGALGGNLIAVRDNDANLALQNPSLLNKQMDGYMSLSYVNYFADVNYGYTSFTKHKDSIGTFSASLMYSNYGSFVRADNFGNKLANFTANDLALVIGAGTDVDSVFSVGANIKLIGSFYDIYTSFGVAVDLAGNYHNEKRLFTASAIIRNVGFQLKSYTESNKESLPFEMQLAISKKLKHAPIRFSLAYENLQKWDLRYIDPTAPVQVDPETFEKLPAELPSRFDNFMRHLVIGSELLLSENFHLRFGYNHRRRQELRFLNRSGMVGISMGLGFRVNKFHFSYGLASYHLSGTSHLFTITSNLSKFVKKN